MTVLEAVEDYIAAWQEPTTARERLERSFHRDGVIFAPRVVLRGRDVVLVAIQDFAIDERRLSLELGSRIDIQRSVFRFRLVAKKLDGETAFVMLDTGHFDDGGQIAVIHRFVGPLD